MNCKHKTLHDHSQPHDKRRLWWCSVCKKAALWDDNWEWFGAVECTSCQSPEIDWVVCSKVCRRKLAEMAL